MELPTVLRFQAQAKRLLELGRGRGDAAPRKAHEKARSDERALAELGDARLGDVAAVKIDLAVEIGGDVELPVSGHRGGKPPGEPAIAAPGGELQRRDQRERIARRFLRPEQ